MLEFYNSLKKELGLCDAAIEYLEFCSRFTEQHSINLQSDIENTGIILNSNEIINIKNMPYQMYIISSYSLLEKFVSDYRICIEKYLNITVTDDSKTSKLDLLLNALKKKYPLPVENIKNSFEYKCIEYYRICRNSGVHKNSKFAKQIEIAFLNMQQSKEWCNIFYKYQIQKEIFCFNDFMLFSNSILTLSKNLMDILESELDQLILKLDLKKLNRYKNQKERYKNAVVQKIMTELCVSKKDAIYFSEKLC